MGPREDPDEGVPFPRMRTVRFVPHPNDPEAMEFHAPGLQSMAHSHNLVEDLPFTHKQRLGAHIDRWHYPEERPRAYNGERG